MTIPVPFDARRRAKHLYWAGYTIEQVGELLDLNPNTMKSWKQRDDWDTASPLERMEGVTEARYCLLTLKDHKTGSDMKEIDLLGRQAERFARVRRYQEPGGHEGDLNPAIANRNKGEKKKTRKNYLTAEQMKAVLDEFDTEMFEYQHGWGSAKIDLLGSTANVTRFILKSRQIGATFYFAREAIARLLTTGNNQIFISASRAQANVFRQYIVDFVFNVTGVQLEGDPIVLDLDGIGGPQGEKPKLYFLGTNYRTAQSYHGDVYLDEVFWIHGFERIDEVASAMATQSRYRITYFSTPSTIAHEANRVWSGEKYNEGREKGEKGDFKFSDEQLRRGVIGRDGIWRQRVTLLDAKEGGCELIDVDRQRQRYSVEAFNNLYLCQFVDDSQSMFPFDIMRRGMVDSWEKWKDFDAYALRPFGDGEVWIGYDPAESAAGDDAAMVVIAAPRNATEKFRVLEKHRLKGLDFAAQAAKIIEQLDRYNVGFIGIDTTGVGAAVWQLVVRKFPQAKRFDYSVALKVAMVLKAKNVISSGRLQYDSGAQDILQSFMAIRAELTGSQKQVTYTASRAGDTGHADLAWAIMHALYNEPLDPMLAGSRKSRVRIFGNGRNEGTGRNRSGERADQRDRRDVGKQRYRREQIVAARSGSSIHVRRSGSCARSAGLPLLRGGPAQQSLVRTGGAHAWPGAHVRHVAASPVGDHLQAQSAVALLPPVAMARPEELWRVRAELPDDGQFILRAA